MLMVPLQIGDVYLLVCLFNKCLSFLCIRRLGREGERETEGEREDRYIHNRKLLCLTKYT